MRRRRSAPWAPLGIFALLSACAESGPPAASDAARGPLDAAQGAPDVITLDRPDRVEVSAADVVRLDRPDVVDLDHVDVVDLDHVDVVDLDHPEGMAEDVPLPPQDVVTSQDVPMTRDVPVTADAPSPTGVPIYAAGDIASCLSPFDEMTADLLDRLPGTILALGDLAYQSGAEWEFLLCYGPTWGRHRARTRPAVGNHEYETRGARDYFRYFGEAAGRPGEGWYSFDHAGWHLVSLNTNCGEVGGCGPDSPQGRWLRADLAAHPARCTLAYMHHPRFSSGRHGSSTGPLPLWEMLHAASVDVVLVGHDHHYERFAPMRPDGTRDDARGMRQFLVGSGGIFHYALGAAQPNSEVRNNDTHGVLELTLFPDRYAWRFVPVAGRTFTDMGSTPCH